MMQRQMIEYDNPVSVRFFVLMWEPSRRFLVSCRCSRRATKGGILRGRRVLAVSGGKTRILGQDKIKKTPDTRKAVVSDKDRVMGSALRSVYQKTVDESVPDDLLDLLGKLT